MFDNSRDMCNFLMIDDSETDLFIMDKMLGKYDLFHRKSFNSDGEKAINKIETELTDESKLPDVIFVDLIMPGFSGRAFLERFKKLYPSIKKTIDVFVITSSVHPDSKSAGDGYSFVKSVLIKPISAQHLTAIYSAYRKTTVLMTPAYLQPL